MEDNIEHRSFWGLESKPITIISDWEEIPNHIEIGDHVIYKGQEMVCLDKQ